MVSSPYRVCWFETPKDIASTSPLKDSWQPSDDWLLRGDWPSKGDSKLRGREPRSEEQHLSKNWKKNGKPN